MRRTRLLALPLAALLAGPLTLLGCDAADPGASSTLTATGPLASAAAKSDVCHYDADAGTYHLINVADASLPAHIAHGDASPGEPVPTQEGYVFDAACVPQAVNLCPCFDAEDLLAVTAENNSTSYSCATASELPFVALIQNVEGTPGVEGGFAAGQGVDAFILEPFCATRDSPETLPVSTEAAAACTQLIVDRCAAIGQPIPASVGGAAQSRASRPSGSAFGIE